MRITLPPMRFTGAPTQNITRATAADIDPAVTVITRVLADTRSTNPTLADYYFDADYPDYVRDTLKDILNNPKGRVYVVKAGTEVVGIGTLNPLTPETSGEINYCYLLKEHQGKGHGKALLKKLMTDAKHLGMNTVYLVTDTYSTPAVGMYQAAGFRQIHNPALLEKILDAPPQKADILMVATIAPNTAKSQPAP